MYWRFHRVQLRVIKVQKRVYLYNIITTRSLLCYGSITSKENLYVFGISSFAKNHQYKISQIKEKILTQTLVFPKFSYIYRNTQFRSFAAIINFRRIIICGRTSWTLNPSNDAVFSFKKRPKMENLSVFICFQMAFLDSKVSRQT